MLDPDVASERMSRPVRKSARVKVMNRYTVKQVADLSSVSVRTLHHYDAIGLLKPVAVSDNGYRYYGRDELLRLQQILFHRALGMSLRDIEAVLNKGDSDRLASLSALRNDLVAKKARFENLLVTLEHTLTHLRDGKALAERDLYSCFEPEQQSAYEEWLIQRFGDEIQDDIDHSKEAYATLSDEERESAMQELAELENGLAEGLRQGEVAKSEALDLLLDRHRAWVAFMWDQPCPVEAYAGLADLYLSHPDFKARYEQIEPGFTAYLTDAMKAYTSRHAG